MKAYCAIIAASLFLFPTVSLCDVDPVFNAMKDDVLTRYEEQLASTLNAIVQCETTKNFLLFTTMVVIFLGAIIAVFQTLKTPWARVATAVLGIGVTTFSGINNTMFEHDYRTYAKRISKANKERVHIETELIKLRGTEDRDIFWEELKKFRRKFDGFSELLEGIDQPPFFLSLAGGPAYAQAGPDIIQVIGQGAGRSLDEAKENASRDWNKKATQELEVFVNRVLDDIEAGGQSATSYTKEQLADSITKNLLRTKEVVDTHASMADDGTYLFTVVGQFDGNFIRDTVAGTYTRVSVLTPIPEMVSISRGCFHMGSPSREKERYNDERRHRICLDGFSIGKYEVTFEEYDRYARTTGRQLPDDEGWGRGRRPVVNVSWDDAAAYADWLSAKTGRNFRLPTEAEWEYATRAGTAKPFWTGQCINTEQANYDGRDDYAGCGADTGVFRRKTVPVGNLPANPWGLHEVLGNLWEWTCSTYEKDYGGSEQRCAGRRDGGSRVRRGGSWSNSPTHLRSAHRLRNSPSHRTRDIGFRLAEE